LLVVPLEPILTLPFIEPPLPLGIFILEEEGRFGVDLVFIFLVFIF
jgi:hypothetical protein